MNKQSDATTVQDLSKSTPVLGILSIVFGGISMLPFLGVVSPIGLILGIIALVKKQKITGVIGTSISAIGIATSPILWGIVICTVNPSACPEKTDSNEMKTVKSSQVIAPQSNYSSSLSYPQGWEAKKFKDNPADANLTIHTFSEREFKGYRIVPDSRVIMMHEVFKKDPSDTIETFITKFIDTNLRPKHPNIVVTPMDSLTIDNKPLSTAHLRMLSNSSLGNMEVVAYIDGGTHVFMFVVSAPNRDELMGKAWAAFSDILLHKIRFTTSGGVSLTTPVQAPAPQPTKLQ
jgi:hypothetical protein